VEDVEQIWVRGALEKTIRDRGELYEKGPIIPWSETQAGFGLHPKADHKRLSQMFLERYGRPRRQIQRKIIEDAIASGELKSTTDPELLIDALNGPLFFRWLQGHAALDKAFAENIFDKVIRAFQPR